jgi:hypothetical protein
VRIKRGGRQGRGTGPWWGNELRGLKLFNHKSDELQRQTPATATHFRIFNRQN